MTVPKDLTSNQKKVYTALSDASPKSVTIAQIVEATDLKYAGVKASLEALSKKGFAKKDGEVARNQPWTISTGAVAAEAATQTAKTTLKAVEKTSEKVEAVAQKVSTKAQHQKEAVVPPAQSLNKEAVQSKVDDIGEAAKKVVVQTKEKATEGLEQIGDKLEEKVDKTTHSIKSKQTQTKKDLDKNKDKLEARVKTLLSDIKDRSNRSEKKVQKFKKKIVEHPLYKSDKKLVDKVLSSLKKEKLKKKDKEQIQKLETKLKK